MNNQRIFELNQINPQLKKRKPAKSNDSDTKITSARLLRTSFFYQTKEFFNNSTLHGVRYIAESDRPFGERFMWFCFTAIGFISALVIIVSLWEKFQTNPTITGLDMDVHNQHLVFPTIVVCPLESYDSNRTYELAYTHLGNYDEDSVNVFESFLKRLTQLNFENMNEAFEATKNITKSANHVGAMNKKSLRSLTFQINVFCNETFEVCKYRDEEIQCCEHFQQIYSEHGFCFAFNPRYIDQSDAEVKNDDFHELFETDKKWALFFTLKREVKIFVHSHHEHFGWDFRPHVIWEPDFAAELLISMKQTYTTEDAKQLSIGQRKCIFPDEIKLDFYDQEYTFTACMRECRIRKSMQLCHCIPPFYRPIPSMPYCTIKDFECLAKFATNITNVRGCSRCELSCANTVYDIEKLSKSTTDPSKPLDTFVNIEYLTWPIIRYKREVLFGWVDLLVSFGGIAGLFLGFSLLSGVEIIYYFTLRTFCMLYKNRQELYEIEEKKLSKPPEFINLSLKLIKPTSKEQSNVRHIEVSEINSNVRQSNRTETVFGPNSTLRDNNIPTERISQLQMTRAARKIAAARALNRLHRTPTSYDYAESTGAYYMP